MMMRGGLLGDYHIMRPGEDFPSQDIVRGPALPGDAGLWQEPEDGRHPGEVMKSPVRRVADQRGLFDSDEDLAAWLARMTAPPQPKSFDFKHSFAPDVQARINAQLQPTSMMPGLATQQGQQAMPQQAGVNAGLSLGPLSLNGGLSTVPTPEGGTRLQPNFGAGMKVPIAGGDASANFNITPGQMKEIEMAYRRKLLGGDLSVQGNYAQPDQGTPSWGGRIGYTRRF